MEISVGQRVRLKREYGLGPGALLEGAEGIISAYPPEATPGAGDRSGRAVLIDVPHADSDSHRTVAVSDKEFSDLFEIVELEQPEETTNAG